MSSSPKTSPNSPFLLRLASKRRGFTLIELLMVFAIIAILAGLTFGIARGVKTTQNKAKARTELAVISQAIEEFKARYGDYPWRESTDSSDSDTNQRLLFALTGRMTVDFDSEGKMVLDATTVDQDNTEVLKRPKFLDDSKFNTRKDEDGNSLELLDPWKKPYIYIYKSVSAPNAWDVYGYHLYSTGPNGENSEEANDAIKAEIDKDTGVISNDFREVADAEGIIFAGE